MPFSPPGPDEETPLLAGLTPRAFLKEYWQRRPLLCRGALSDWRCPIDADDLAGLAMEAEAESRLIYGSGDDADDYHLKHGPFAEKTLTSLPSKDWTLLVQGVEQWVPAVTELAHPYRFLPDWRIDDIMVSTAAPGGSVGPHVDAYDVFLVQGHGTRTWLLGGDVGTDPPLADHPDLKLMQSFETVAEHVLGPGDVLYVPPGHAHWGIGGGDGCLTLSLGFRAPSAVDLLDGMADVMSDLPLPDRGREPTDNAGSISGADLDRMAGLLSVLVQDRAALLSVLGRWSSRPKSEETFSALNEPLDPETLTTIAEDGLALSPGSRLLYHQGVGGFRCFADGEEMSVDLAAAPFAARFADRRVITGKEAVAALAQEETCDLLHALAARGVIVPLEEGEPE